MRALAIAVLLGALAGGIAAAYHAHRSTPAEAKPATTPSRAAGTPVAITDLPIPESRSLEALAAYRAAIQAARDGAALTAVASLRRAVAADPTMAAAWWRLADLLAGIDELEKAREAYARAMQLRGALTERDRAYFLADEPIVVWPVADPREARRRFEALAVRYPLDAEIQATVAFFAHWSADYPAARAAIERAIALDPQYATAWLFRGWIAQGEDDEATARAAFARCQEIAPAATNCITRLALLQGLRGDCVAMATASERLAAVAPTDLDGAKYEALASAVQGAEPDVLRERIARWAERVNPPSEKGGTLAKLELWNGDFHAALADVDAMEAALGTTPARSAREAAARIRAEALVESGRVGDAGRVSARVLERAASTETEINFSPQDDATPTLLAIARRAGTLSPAAWAVMRDTWRARWEHGTPWEDSRDIWLAQALSADSARDAEASLASMPAKLPRLRWDGSGDRAIGKLYFLVGRTDDAIPWLTREAASCMGLETPIAHIHSRFLLGQALENHGDTTGACAAYAFVDARWGHARPRSVTAEAAKARATALRCPPTGAPSASPDRRR